MKIETASRFAVINNPRKIKNFDVYIDGSFGSDYTSDINEASPYGSGWVMVNSNAAKPEMLGYGMTQFWDTYSPQSEIGEMRSILQFFEGLEEFFPHMMTQEYQYRVICDNKGLVHLANKAQINKEAARYVKQKYGEDFTRLQKFVERTRINFKWVKGHAANKFNCFADTMAHRAYKAGCHQQEFNGLSRFCFIMDLIIKRRLVNQEVLDSLRSEMFLARRKLHGQKISNGQSSAKMEQWNQGNVLPVATVSVQDEAENYHQGIVFSMDRGENLTTGTQIIEGAGVSKNAIHLRAVQQMLFAYRTADSVDTSKHLTILTNLKALPPIINALGKGVTPNTSSCPQMVTEIENLRILMMGMKVRAVYDGDLLVSSMSHYASRLARESVMAAQDERQNNSVTEKVLSRQ